jgi:hypothetical protein
MNQCLNSPVRLNKYVYCDAEFNRHCVLCFCFLTSEGVRLEVDCRSGDPTELQAIIDALRDHIFVAFNCLAEMGAFKRMGVDFTAVRWIDLMSEASMITGTYPHHASHSKGLLATLKAFEVEHDDTFAKKDMYRLILSKDEFTDQEFADILAYCWTDVDPMPELHGKVQNVLLTVPNYRGSWKTEHSLERGRFVMATAVLEGRTKGLPVDVEWLNTIAEYIEPMRNLVTKRCNDHYGAELFVQDPKTGDYRESKKNLEALVTSLGYDKWWERTASGQLTTSEEYLDDICKGVPFLREYKRCRDMRKETKAFSLPSLVVDGFVRPGSVPYYTKTSRSQPFVKDGFIFNMAPWIRSVVRPEPGWVIIAGDYSKQEIAIAADLTGDPDFLAAYTAIDPETGKADIYLNLAKMAGAILPGMTKDEIKLIRQAYKSVQLGLGYGMGLVALASSIYADLNGGQPQPVITIEEATQRAYDIYNWHKRTFKQYWKWLNEAEQEARRVGLAESFDHWLYFVSPSKEVTLRNQLINFPVQANAAMMLREAVKSVAFETDLQVLCTLHDAIYAYCREEDAEATKATLREHMQRAVKLVCLNGVPVEVGFSVYTHETGYTDERATDVLREIKAMVEAFKLNPPEPWSPPPPKPRKKPKAAEVSDEFFVFEGRAA